HLEGDAIDGDVFCHRTLIGGEQLLADLLADHRHLAALRLVQPVEGTPFEDLHRIEILDAGKASLDAEAAILRLVDHIRRAATPDADGVLPGDEANALHIARDAVDIFGFELHLAADGHSLVRNL